MDKKFDRKILYSYLQEKYSITKLPKQFFIKMSNIFKGNLNGQNKPILPEHMYDMWTQKSNYLDRVYMNNVTKGKKMDAYVRLNYDLAIIMSKYDDYLGWLDRQKLLTADNENLKENVTVTDVIHNQHKYQNNSSVNNDDISDILDDLI
jgi:hypothetical protein